MPLYEYKCEACGQRFEVIRKFSDPPLDVCASCGKGPVTRLQSSPAFQFKGTGWYVTDYAQKGKPEQTTKEKSEGKPDAAKPDTGGKSDTAAKSDAPAASTSAPSASSTAAKE